MRAGVILLDEWIRYELKVLKARATPARNALEMMEEREYRRIPRPHPLELIKLNKELVEAAGSDTLYNIVFRIENFARPVEAGFLRVVHIMRKLWPAWRSAKFKPSKIREFMELGGSTELSKLLQPTSLRYRTTVELEEERDYWDCPFLK